MDVRYLQSFVTVVECARWPKPRGAHASLSLALLHEAEAIFNPPAAKVSALPRRRA